MNTLFLIPILFIGNSLVANEVYDIASQSKSIAATQTDACTAANTTIDQRLTDLCTEKSQSHDHNLSNVTHGECLCRVVTTGGTECTVDGAGVCDVVEK